MVTKLEAKPSFFHFFSDPIMDHDDDEGDVREGDEYKLTVDEDYEVGHSFRIEIIPDALAWFTGEAVEEDDDDDEEEEDGDFDVDEDEEDDEDAPADTSEEVVDAGVRGKKKGFALPETGGTTGQQPECKQS